MLVKVRSPHVNKVVCCYAIIDEESDSSYIHPKLIDALKVKSKTYDYSVRTLSKHVTKLSGRIAKGLSIRGFKESKTYKLPNLFEAEFIPNSLDEVATPQNVRGIPAVEPFADKFHPIRKGAQVLILIGRNNPKLISTETFTDYAPVVHKTPLGWCLVGESNPKFVQAGEELRSLLTREGLSSELTFHKEERLGSLPSIEDPLFQLLPNDEQEDLSQDDREFLEIFQKGVKRNKDGRLQAPLPFRGKSEPQMPDNERDVFLRTKNTLRRLQANPELCSFIRKVMANNMEQKHVELVPEDELKVDDGRCWYLPVFVTTPPRKKPRLVFDSAATFGPEEVSLNSKMLQGPDTNNRLRDVLLRFREGPVGWIADIEQMFHCFLVDPNHRDYMRFHWWLENDPTKPLVVYRARVHIFGNTGSPAVADNSFKLTTDLSDPPPTPEVKRYLHRHFYVDDGCGSAKDAETAISIIKGSRATLSQFGIRLCKIMASNPVVVKAFPESEVAKDLVEVDFDDCPMQRTLGVAWDIKSDSFVMKVNLPSREFSKRGILSTINSVFDPIGLASPACLAGRLFQRSILPKKGQGSAEIEELGWDDILPATYRQQWENFKSQLPQLEKLTMPRGLTPIDFGNVVKQDIFSFADASELAIGWGLYMRSVNEVGKVHVSFITGGSKVAPQGATSIPRLELCAALQCAVVTDGVKKALNRTPDNCYFYTDSKCVLGYLSNTAKRFTRYVTRRIQLILNLAKNWQYIGTSSNPADIASRPQTPKQLLRSKWLSGPDFLWASSIQNPETFQALLPEELPELVIETRALVSKQSGKRPFDSVFEKLSEWQRMVRVAARVQDYFKKVLNYDKFELTPSELLIREAQISQFSDIISLLEKEKPLPEDHPLASLSPIIQNGLIRVGGRLDRSRLPFDRKHPLLVPRNHPVAKAIISHFHRISGHQGRHITRGLIIQGGFHIQNGSKLIKQFLSECILCRRLRGKLASQKMADLPQDRVEGCPPFTNTGIDVTGPWKVQRGRTTRQTAGQIKVWTLLFTCMASRAIHVELLTSLDTPTFKNALSRFLAVRGTVRRLRSDQGRNFVGAQPEDVKAEVDVEELQRSMNDRGVEWIFNPPSASHFGGVWERKIGSLKRVLEGTLVLMGPRSLTFDELHTFMVEAASIVNSTPLWEVSNDPNDPMPLAPSNIITLRDHPNPPPPEKFTEDDLLSYGKRRWRRVQYLSDQFWSRWYDEYLYTLQKRSKWTKIKRNFKPGDLVMLRDKSTVRNSWPLGRISSVKKSADGLVRSLDVVVSKMSAKGVMKRYEYTRPVSEIIFISSE